MIAKGDGSIYLGQVGEPSMNEYDCLVKIHSCLFCNSTDSHIINNRFDFGLHYPNILGHESVGVVVKLGRKVKNFKVGDKVVHPYAIYSGEESGGFGSGWGGMAEYGKICDAQAMVKDGVAEEADLNYCFRYMQKVPDDISLDQAMLLCCQKEIYSSVKQISKTQGQSFLITGCGIVCLL